MKKDRGQVNGTYDSPKYESGSGTILDGTWTTATDSNGTVGTSGGTVWYTFQDNTDNLLGKVLTVIDATYASTEQREAVKSLIKDAFSNYRSPQTWTYC